MPKKSKEELKEKDIKITKTTKTSKKSVAKSKTSSNLEKKNVSTQKTTKATSASSAKVNKTTKSEVKSKKVAKKTSTTRKRTTSSKSISSVEYYDLPYRYNETVVKILAQTPTTLFIYWDISDADRNKYMDIYGENFFDTTKPVLVVTNKTKNYSFEVEINDFANSWYLHVNDSYCDYSIELGRRPINNNKIDNYVYITTSNDMDMPNNHILFDKLGKTVFFKNIKNNLVEEKEISSISFIKHIGNIHSIYELYKELYNGEIIAEDLTSNNLFLNLSSSNSSTFK